MSENFNITDQNNFLLLTQSQKKKKLNL